MCGEPKMDENDWALEEKVPECVPKIMIKELDITDPWYRGEEWAKYHMVGKEYTFINGKLTVKINPEGWISFYNQKGDLLFLGPVAELALPVAHAVFRHHGSPSRHRTVLF
mgnify:CR=1 FL=1